MTAWIWDWKSHDLYSFFFKSIFLCLLQSVVAFLKDPEGAPLWEEDPDAKDVVHVDSEKVGRCFVCFINMWDEGSVYVCVNS